MCNFKIEVQSKGQNSTFMLGKFAVTKCTAPLSEQRYFSFDLPRRKVIR